MENQSPTELAAKYQRLAAEYSKMRAQNTVLKKAVVDEQGKSVQLKEELQLKDQTIRKYDQEMDSLTFRNTQLEKRVGFLQEELAAATNKNKVKGKSKGNAESPVPETNQSPLDFELISKIEENILLHKQISQLEETYRKDTDDLRQQLEQKNKDSPSRQLQVKADALEAEKLSLTYSLQNSLDEIEAYRDQVNQLQEKIRNLMLFPDTLGQSNKSSNNAPLLKSHSEDLTSSFDSAHITELKPLHLNPDDTSIPNLIEKLTSAEQQREHLMLEYQLLKMKYSKIFMKWEESKQILKSLNKEDLMSGDITPSTETVQSFTSMIGKIDVISDDPQSWGRSYEKEVKDYLKIRINELIGLLQLADSKAVTFHSECVSLQNLLTISVEKKKEAESQLQNAERNFTDLQEELQLTKNNYETQLSTMTEHLANMNEKLTLQKDTIDDLKYQLTNKGNGKQSKK
ncbi:unnamed protein product [Allacma fusca]|uniref:Protein phosphatase 1 regulatory subunit 21 N-terminal domain-containing protein n=1 Tax=Allacma fusca TaxID=39272 RepID=A0A8J2KK26_9HEXA|nr:unnamed protein product [Allacma fusca]